MKNKNELIEYWAKSSKMDIDAALDLYKTKKFPHCLFFAHLSVEKLFKALFVKTNEKHSPITHNLMLLAKESKLELSELQVEQLAEINTFNIEARYPDEKFRFYKKCTPEFTEKYMEVIEEMLNWLTEKL
ncbi:MAG: HEPN domain-containing protein [Candidatus Aminicenantes bacterium]|nr:HEPN domain-containing protein [Candidatus Aminicenantes bacterium]